jgi:hypothetical protein
VGQLWIEVSDWVVNRDWRSQWDSCGLKFLVGLWIQTGGVSGTAVDWSFWLGCGYRLTEWLGQLWLKFVIGLWIQIDGVSGTAVDWRLGLGCERRLTEWVGQLLGEACVWIVNNDWQNERDRCGVKFVIRLWIQTDRVSGTAGRWGFWLGFEHCLKETMWQLCGDVCNWVVNRDLRVEWAPVVWHLWLVCGYWLSQWLGRLWGQFFNWVVNTDWRREQLWGDVCDWVYNIDWRTE